MRSRGHADRLPGADRLLVGAEAELVVALEDRDPDVLGLEPEVLERELPRELDGALLEVVAEREVAEHLEEGQVAGGEADLLDVRRAKAALAGREAVVRRLLQALEVGLERVHPRGGEQDRRVVGRGHERRRRQALVVARLEVLQEALADLVRGHLRDCRASDDGVPAQQAGDLARRGALERLEQVDRAVAVEAARHRRGPVAELDGVDRLRRAMQAQAGDRHAGRGAARRAARRPRCRRAWR